MRIKITAGGIYDGEGKEIPIGTELEVADPELNDEGFEVAPHQWAGRFETISGSQTGKTGVTNTDTPPPAGPFEAKDKGEGWWQIVDGAGEQVGKSIRKADGEAFNTLSDDDKAAFAAEHAKA